MRGDLLCALSAAQSRRAPVPAGSILIAASLLLSLFSVLAFLSAANWGGYRHHTDLPLSCSRSGCRVVTLAENIEVFAHRLSSRADMGDPAGRLGRDVAVAGPAFSFRDPPDRQRPGCGPGLLFLDSRGNLLLPQPAALAGAGLGRALELFPISYSSRRHHASFAARFGGLADGLAGLFLGDIGAFLHFLSAGGAAIASPGAPDPALAGGGRFYSGGNAGGTVKNDNGAPSL